ncbi:hypothetical protein QN353_21515, partial [Undibacterium sp. 10I3]|nr:hypothetical protein [Undibacterium sp. 10I3]
VCAKENASEQEFRQQCLQAFTNHKALDFMFNQIKEIALRGEPEQDSHGPVDAVRSDANDDHDDINAAMDEENPEGSSI